MGEIKQDWVLLVLSTMSLNCFVLKNICAKRGYVGDNAPDLIAQVNPMMAQSTTETVLKIVKSRERYELHIHGNIKLNAKFINRITSMLS